MVESTYKLRLVCRYSIQEGFIFLYSSLTTLQFYFSIICVITEPLARFLGHQVLGLGRQSENTCRGVPIPFAAFAVVVFIPRAVKPHFQRQ